MNPLLGRSFAHNHRHNQKANIMTTPSTARHVIRVAAKFTMSSGKTLKEIAAASEKLDKGFAALAAEIGIEVGAIEHTAQPVREAAKETPPATPPAPEPEDPKDGKAK